MHVLQCVGACSVIVCENKCLSLFVHIYIYISTMHMCLCIRYSCHYAHKCMSRWISRMTTIQSMHSTVSCAVHQLTVLCIDRTHARKVSPSWRTHSRRGRSRSGPRSMHSTVSWCLHRHKSSNRNRSRRVVIGSVSPSMARKRTQACTHAHANTHAHKTTYTHHVIVQAMQDTCSPAV